MRIKFISWLLLLTTFSSAVFAQDTYLKKHPSWILQGNVYEVNVRQYTPEGTFNAFSKHLNRLQKMGVQTLWFMPINPISKKDRKGTLGSYYAVADYTSVNPEYGTLADWKKLVKAIHAKGMKVIIDWVPNHTGADHYWLKTRPDFFVKDSTGQAATMFDWTDTRVLNYKNAEMQDSMIQAMKYWITATGIDGYRCDVAWNVPGSFWIQCTKALEKIKPDVFMLAEGMDAYLHRSGFDATYPWDFFHMMIKVAAGERPAFALDSVKAQYDTAYPSRAIEMHFTSNHDENSWNKADYGVFPGAVHAPFAVLTQTYARSVPLIYSGQEEPVLRPLSFFEKDPITFKKYSRAGFYTKLLQLRKNNPALAADAAFSKVKVGNPAALYAYTRKKGKNQVLVILNLSAKEQTVTIKDATLHGNALNWFGGNQEMLSDKRWQMEPWGYAVYVFPSAR